MRTKTMETNQDLTAKVAAMSYEERWARLEELSHTDLTPETRLEFAKLLLGAETTVREDR